MPDDKEIKRRLYHNALGMERQARQIVRWWASAVNLRDKVGPEQGELEAIKENPELPASPGLAREHMLVEAVAKLCYRTIWNARQFEVERGADFLKTIMDELAALQKSMPPISSVLRSRDPGPPPAAPPPPPDEDEDGRQTEEPEADGEGAWAGDQDPGGPARERDAQDLDQAAP